MPEMKSSDAVENQNLKIKEVINSRRGALTRIYGVYSRSTNVILGYISFYPHQKQYIFGPEPGTKWLHDDLDFISNFLKNIK